MILANREESKRIDQLMARTLARDPIFFMEAAATSISEFIQKKFNCNSSLIFFCGPGNNGGDGFAAARLLKLKNYTVQVVYLEAAHSNPLWSEEFVQLQQVGIVPLTWKEFLARTQSTEILYDSSESSKMEKVCKYDVIVDALFGYGLNRNLNSTYIEAIKWINNQKGSVISIDAPSGLDVDTGMIFGACVQAVITLTVEISKPGFYLNYGPRFCGSIIIIHAGFDRKLIRELCTKYRVVNPKLIKKLLPLKSEFSHKAKNGKLLIIAGSDSMMGALRLTSMAAARLGVGYISIVSWNQKIEYYAPNLPPDFLHLKFRDFLNADLEQYNAILCGPGLGKIPKLKIKKIKQKLFSYSGKVLIDADSLLWFKSEVLPQNWVLTPHAGELSRLIDIPNQRARLKMTIKQNTSHIIECDRIKYAEWTQKKMNAVILLKGFHTVISRRGRTYIVNAGNPALAKAGTGDVLSGFIASLMAQKLESVDSAIVGALIHGALADKWISQGKGLETLLASDLIDLLPEILK